ncbi:hypothetical protein K503DRAFT_780367 [Rhizopogon vinicolor AM-OR11-026]|uniref:BTB domain-containing protein n=1 Tax=Rhizopogon vinicolor AM-OR11-026 TaxID=1314800 RepID=A0A1B7NAH1_9AGAM|nr:hypothetical protein K503DRAFT_780367 [Rhizopogon vinicolor AM-OR11-026]
MANNSQDGNSSTNHHPEYYLGDGNVTFVVENTLFCVHRFFFERESKDFFEDFAKALQDGISDGGPFLLEGITSADFETLLWVWYSPKYRLDKKQKDHWLVILDLSTRWQFPRMKELAVEQLQSLEIDPVEKVTIYDKYGIDRSLLLREYKRLCTREGQMSTEEGEKVKLPTVLGIYQARERAIRSAAGKEHRNPTPADADEEELEKILIDIFNLNICPSVGLLDGASNQTPSGDTNRQIAQSQGQSNSAFTQPDAYRTTSRSSWTDSSSQNDNERKDTMGTKHKIEADKEQNNPHVSPYFHFNFYRVRDNSRGYLYYPICMKFPSAEFNEINECGDAGYLQTCQRLYACILVVVYLYVVLSNVDMRSGFSTSNPRCFNMQELPLAAAERSRVQELVLHSDQSVDELKETLDPLSRHLLNGLAYTIGSALGSEPPTREECLIAFSIPNRVGLMAGARAWSKHSHRSRGETPGAGNLPVDRNGEGQMKINIGWWSTPYGSVSSINERALALFERVVDKSTWRNIHWLPHQVLVYEVRVEEGYGMRWSQDRSVLESGEGTELLPWSFRGFVEPMMENGHEIGWKHGI